MNSPVEPCSIVLISMYLLKGFFFSWLLAMLSTVFSSRNLLRKQFSCELHIKKSIFAHTLHHLLFFYLCHFTAMRSTFFPCSHWDLEAVWCFISIPHIQAQVRLCAWSIAPESTSDFLLSHWQLPGQQCADHQLPCPFFPQLPSQIQSSHIQFPVLLPLEVQSIVILKPF